MIKTNNATLLVVPRMRTKNPIWRTAAILEIETCHNSTTIQRITTKFYKNMPMVITNRAEGENLHILKIQDGGRPPY